jgi:hypothetical protein
VAIEGFGAGEVAKVVGVKCLGRHDGLSC